MYQSPYVDRSLDTDFYVRLASKDGRGTSFDFLSNIAPGVDLACPYEAALCEIALPRRWKTTLDCKNIALKYCPLKPSSVRTFRRLQKKRNHGEKARYDGDICRFNSDSDSDAAVSVKERKRKKLREEEQQQSLPGVQEPEPVAQPSEPQPTPDPNQPDPAAGANEPQPTPEDVQPQVEPEDKQPQVEPEDKQPQVKPEDKEPQVKPEDKEPQVAAEQEEQQPKEPDVIDDKDGDHVVHPPQLVSPSPSGVGDDSQNQDDSFDHPDREEREEKEKCLHSLEPIGGCRKISFNSDHTYTKINDFLNELNTSSSVNYITISPPQSEGDSDQESVQDEDNDDDDDDHHHLQDSDDDEGESRDPKKKLFKFSDVVQFRFCPFRQKVFIERKDLSYILKLDFTRDFSELLGFKKRTDFLILDRKITWADERENLSRYLSKRLYVHVFPDMEMSKLTECGFHTNISGRIGSACIASFNVAEVNDPSDDIIVYRPHVRSYFPLVETRIRSIGVKITNEYDKTLEELSPSNSDFVRPNEFSETLLHYRPVLYNTSG